MLDLLQYKQRCTHNDARQSTAWEDGYLDRYRLERPEIHNVTYTRANKILHVHIILTLTHANFHGKIRLELTVQGNTFSFSLFCVGHIHLYLAQKFTEVSM
jgi:hypothetical protein